jgi:nitrous oxidase accessory protein
LPQCSFIEGIEKPLYPKQLARIYMVSNSKILALLLALFFLISIFTFQPVTVKAQARTLVVPDQYPTIQSAVGNASDGDTVFVKRGVYLENSYTGIVIDKPISLVGDDQQTIIRPKYYYRYHYQSLIQITSDNVQVSDLTIDGAVYNITLAQMLGHSSSWTPLEDAKYDKVSTVNTGISLGDISGKKNYTGCKIYGNNVINTDLAGIGVSGVGNEVYQNTVSGIFLGGQNNRAYQNNVTSRVYISSSNSVLDGNYISGISSEYYQAIIVDSCKNVTIKNNIVTGNSNGLFLRWDGTYYVFQNNITNNLGYGIQIGDSCSNAMIYDNNIVNNTIGINVPNHSLSTLIGDVGKNNLVFNNNLLHNRINAVVNNTFPYNLTDVKQSNEYFTGNGTDIVAWDNGVVGNNWSDYNGLGAYVINQNNIDHHPLTQPVDISAPALTLPFVELTAVVIAVIIIVIVIISLLVFRRHRKTVNVELKKEGGKRVTSPRTGRFEPHHLHCQSVVLFRRSRQAASIEVLLI